MPKILLIEDNPGDVRLIQEFLKESEKISNRFDIVSATRLRDAVELLAPPHSFDIILSDIALPDSGGIKTLKALSTVASDIPVIFMTGTSDEVLAEAAIHQGAQDYLVKGRFNSGVLERAITYAIGRKASQKEMNIIKAREQANEQHIKALALETKQLTKLNRSKDEFISLASHQLRTPATVVKQYLGMVIEGFTGEITETQRNVLQSAYESNERQLSVINELLQTAQLDAKKIELNLTPHDITSIISEVIHNLQPIFDLRSQTIEFDDNRHYYVLIDPHEMKLVIENLIENAGKYTPRNKTITIRIIGTKSSITVHVIDQGVGIELKDQQRIFEKFTRVDNDLSDTVMGTGLGLYWVKRIMKLHHGSVSVTSVPGQGSNFSLRLPV